MFSYLLLLKQSCNKDVSKKNETRVLLKKIRHERIVYTVSLTNNLQQIGLEFQLANELIDDKYGNTGCQVFKRGIHNQKDFMTKINIPKRNYCILRIGVMGRCQKMPIFYVKNHWNLSPFFFIEENRFRSTFFVIDIF